MPAAAVIPAPLAYIKVVAVKKLVVECSGCFVCGWALSAPRCVSRSLHEAASFVT